MVVDLQIRHARPDLAHDAAGLVAEHHRHRPRARAVDRREVGVAQPRADDLDEHLAGAGRVELQVLDHQRRRLGVRPGLAHLVQHGGFGAHRTISSSSE